MCVEFYGWNNLQNMFWIFVFVKKNILFNVAILGGFLFTEFNYLHKIILKNAILIKNPTCTLYCRIDGRPGQVSLLSQLRFQRDVVIDYMAKIQYKSCIDNIYGPLIYG